jgi:hypothetical protein
LVKTYIPLDGAERQTFIGQSWVHRSSGAMARVRLAAMANLSARTILTLALGLSGHHHFVHEIAEALGVATTDVLARIRPLAALVWIGGTAGVDQDIFIAPGVPWSQAFEAADELDASSTRPTET